MTLMSFAMSARPSISRRSRGARLRFRVFPLQKWQDLFHERVCRNTVLFPKDRYRAVFDKLIGPADPYHRCVDQLAVQMFHDGTAESVVQNVILDGADDLDAARKKLQRSRIERLDPTWIDQCDGNAFFI